MLTDVDTHKHTDTQTQEWVLFSDGLNNYNYNKSVCN